MINALTRSPALDFTSLISNLDNTASEIVTYQRDSTVQRKDLAQKTKDFRKLDDSGKLSEIKGLLKGGYCAMLPATQDITNPGCSLPNVYRSPYEPL